MQLCNTAGGTGLTSYQIFVISPAIRKIAQPVIVFAGATEFGQAGNKLFIGRKNIFFYGLVLNAHINNLQGEDMYVVALFRSKSKSVNDFSFILDYSELLLAPLMIDRIYWTKELFYNVGHIDNLGTPPSYGFFKIARENQFWNEFDEPLEQRPEYLSSGAQTSIGVGYKVNKEIIIDDSLLRFE